MVSVDDLRRLLFPKPELQNSCEANAYDESGVLVYEESKGSFRDLGKEESYKKTDLSQVLSVWGGVCFFLGGCFVDYRWGCVWVIICH